MAFLTKASKLGLRNKSRNTRVQPLSLLSLVPIQNRQGDRKTKSDPTGRLFTAGALWCGHSEDGSHDQSILLCRYNKRTGSSRFSSIKLGAEMDSYDVAVI